MAIVAGQLEGSSPDIGQLVQDTLGLVETLARQICRKVRWDLDDAVAEGMFGLMQAAQSFDKTVGVEFPAYARFRIYGQMIDGWRDFNGVKRKDRSKVKSRVVSQLNDTRATSFDVMGQSLDVIAAAVLSPLDQLIIKLGLSEEQQEATWRQSEIRRAVSLLEAADRFVIEQYYWNGHTLRIIGAAMGVSEVRAAQRRRAAFEKMRQVLQGAQITHTNFGPPITGSPRLWRQRLRQLSPAYNSRQAQRHLRLVN